MTFFIFSVSSSTSSIFIGASLKHFWIIEDISFFIFLLICVLCFLLIEKYIYLKESKDNLSLNTINLKTENSLKQKIYIYNLIFILYYYFKFDVKNPIKYIKILSYQNFMQIYKIKKQIYIFYCIYNKIYFKNNQ